MNDNDNRLTESEFDQEYGERLAQSIGWTADGKCVVNSALTRKTYIYWDWTLSKYVVEAR